MQLARKNTGAIYTIRLVITSFRKALNLLCLRDRQQSIVLLLLLCIGTGNCLAAGFQLSEQSVSGLGDAFAGSGVVPNDAAVVFYNPASMADINGQRIQGGINSVFLDIDFQDDDTSTGGGEADTTTLVPSLFYISEGHEQWKFGVGLTVPFGLKTHYDTDWVGRYHAIDSELATVNIGPTVSYRINSQISIGAGFDIQYADALLSRASPPVMMPTFGDSLIEIEGDSWGYGYNFGLTYQLEPSLIFGLSYRSKVKHVIDGYVKVSNSDIGLDGYYDAETEVTLPETAYFSGQYRVNYQWQLLATARWTKWERFDVLRVVIQDLPDEVVPERWENTWMYSIGANYQASDRVTLRAGLARDRSPVPNMELRTPRIPDSDRDWITMGVSFQAHQRTSIDVSLAYLNSDEVALDNTAVFTSNVEPVNRLSGTVDSSVMILGMQARHQF